MGDAGGIHRFLVDHLEGGYAVGALEDGERLDLPLRLLPDPLREGDVLVFESVELAGERVVRIRVDPVATAARAAEAAQRLGRLRAGDTGGDLAL